MLFFIVFVCVINKGFKGLGKWALVFGFYKVPRLGMIRVRYVVP